MPRSSREKSAETRSHIIDAAYSLFVSKGYNATPMREVSQKAGVTVGAIYNHFATKEDIWISVLIEKHPYHEILPLILQAEGDTIAEVLRSAARSMIKTLNNRPDLFHMVFIEIVEFKSVHVPYLYQEIVPHLGGLVKLLENKRGRLREIPVQVVLRSFVGLFLSFYVTGMLFKDMEGISTDETSLDQFVDLYLNGVLSDDDPMREKVT